MRKWEIDLLNLTYSLAWGSVIAECLEKRAVKKNQQTKMFLTQY